MLNMRLGLGICLVFSMLVKGVLVGFGVDGSASNDFFNMLCEA